MKNLENYGVVSLDSREMKETDGGIFWWIVGCLAYELLSDGPGGCGQDFMDGFESAS